MKEILKKAPLLLSLLGSTALINAQSEIYVQPACDDEVCYETYYRRGCQPADAFHETSVPEYCVAPEVLHPPLDRGEIFVRADFLYWKTHNNGVSRCLPAEETYEVNQNGKMRIVRKIKNKDPHFDWAPGFRLGTGYHFMDTAWEVAAYWTYLYSKADTKLGRQEKMHWGLNLNIADMLAGYKFCLAPWFSLKPYVGLRIAGIDQSIHTKTGEIKADLQKEFKGRSKQDYVGVGPLLGIEAILDLDHGFNVYANAAVSGLYGNNHLSSKGESVLSNYSIYSSSKHHLNVWQTVVDLGLGLRYERNIDCYSRNFNLVLDLGLEHHCFYKQNRFGSLGFDDSNHRVRCGDLFFDGVTVSAKVIF